MLWNYYPHYSSKHLLEPLQNHLTMQVITDYKLLVTRYVRVSFKEIAVMRLTVAQTARDIYVSEMR